MKNLSWLADFDGELDEVALAKMVKKLNLHPLDLLAVAAKIVECRNRTNHHHAPQNQKQKTQIIDDHEAAMEPQNRKPLSCSPSNKSDVDDDNDNNEAAMLKHERNLDPQKTKVLSCSPSNKPYTHVVDDQSPIWTLSCIPSNKPNTYNIDDHQQKPMIEEDLLPFRKRKHGSSPAVSFSAKRKGASIPNQGNLKLKKPFNGPILSPTPLSFVLPLPDNTNISKKDRIKKKKKKKLTYKGPDTPPDLPIEFRNQISEMGGSEIQLLIQKPLYPTDISESHSRLSMPASQIKALNFVREEEWVTMASKQGDGYVSVVENVPMIDTKLRTRIISLRKRNKVKPNHKSSVMYVLSTTWNDLVKSNQLKCGNIIQVWSFRVGSELNIAIVLVEDCVFVQDDESGAASSSSSEDTW